MQFSNFPNAILQVVQPRQNWQKTFQLKSWFLRVLCVGIVLSLGSPMVIKPRLALGAERLDFLLASWGDFSISVQDLETFAREGKASPELAVFTSLATPQQLAAFRNVMQLQYDVDSDQVQRVLKTNLSRRIFHQLGQVLKPDQHQDPTQALQTAFLRAAASPQGWSVLNLLHHYPGSVIQVDLQQGLKLVTELSLEFQQANQIVSAIQQQAAEGNPTQMRALPDLRQPGAWSWQKQTLLFQNAVSRRVFPADIYLPAPPGRPGQNPTAAPVVVIFYNLASDRNSFAYLAQHLASHGFVVAVPQNPRTDFQTYEGFLRGLENPPELQDWVYEPLDVTFLLNGLEQRVRSDPTWQGRLNLQQVGLIGQSSGGYAVLALAGAGIDLKLLQQACSQTPPEHFSFNLALLIQCGAVGLPKPTYALRDRRVKAVIAVNPISGAIFGQRGLRQLQVPVMMIAGSDDAIAPAVPEQIIPFTWLITADKYLVLMQRGTHFSFLGSNDQVGETVPPELLGPDPALARPVLNTLSTAFFSVYLRSQSQYRPYLSQSYLQSLSQQPFSFSVVKNLPGPLRRTIYETKGIEQIRSSQ